jgi:trk system potassium uptake protein
LVAVGPVLYIVGMLLSILAVTMCIPAAVDLQAGNPDWQVFIGAAALTLFVGVLLMLTTRGRDTTTVNLRQAFLLTLLSWFSIAAAGSFPFIFSKLDMSVADAFFESMSGITTTGSTVIGGLDYAPPGILIWRAILQWLGGIGIIVMALAVLPMLSVGGMQLFRTEAFDTPDKVLPRAATLAGGIGAIYLGVTFLCAMALWLAGMSGFDAVAHAMTTIATGGYSTHDASVGHFNSQLVEWIIIAGMIVGSLPFVYYLQTVRGDITSLIHDSQVHWFLAIAAAATAAMFVWIYGTHSFELEPALRQAAFSVVSIMTGTGYTNADFGAWGGFPLVLLLVLMFIGGCAGSTTCGIKVFRVQVLFATSKVQLARLLHPHGVFIPYYNRKPIPETVTGAVMGFFFFYIASCGLLATALGALGLDFITALSGAVTAISNVGPGLGNVIGATGNFDGLPDTAKWLLSFGMLLGRLELFTVLVILTPAFWRR